MASDTKAKKAVSKWKTVSLPRGLTDDIQFLLNECGYWPSVSSFVREATLEKLKVERRNLRENREAKERSDSDEPT